MDSPVVLATNPLIKIKVTPGKIKPKIIEFSKKAPSGTIIIPHLSIRFSTNSRSSAADGIKLILNY